MRTRARRFLQRFAPLVTAASWHRICSTIASSSGGHRHTVRRTGTRSRAWRCWSKADTEPPYLDTTYWQSHAVIPWGLWLLGEWGEVLREIKVAVTMLEKNGDDRAAQMLRLFQAWVHLHAMDFAGVRAICEAVFSWLGEPSATSTLRICQVLAGAAETGLEQREAAAL